MSLDILTSSPRNAAIAGAIISILSMMINDRLFSTEEDRVGFFSYIKIALFGASLSAMWIWMVSKPSESMGGATQSSSYFQPNSGAFGASSTPY